jgi:iron complex transport system ATP-binding protein
VSGPVPFGPPRIGPGPQDRRPDVVRPGALAPSDGRPTTPAGDPIVELAAMSVSYRTREVLHGIDLAIAAGERLALVGPNGAGKSTLLRVIAGTLAPGSGSVRLQGSPIGGLGRRAVARRIAVVPQLAALPFAARVEDVVALGRLPYEGALRGPDDGDRAVVGWAMERVGVTALRDRDARELSLGERQLVLIAMAVAQSTPVLLLDEPTVHLDLRHRVEAMELLTDLNERDGTTVIAVLHDLNLAARFFPRVVLLEGGRVVGDGPPASVLSTERLRAVFGIDPVMAGLPEGGLA